MATNREENICCVVDPETWTQISGISNTAGFGSIGMNDVNSNVLDVFRMKKV